MGAGCASAQRVSVGRGRGDRVSWPCGAAAPPYVAGPARPGGEEPGMQGARRRRRAGPCSVSPGEQRLFGLGARQYRGCPREEAAPASPLLSPSSLSLSPRESSPRFLLPSRAEAVTDLGGCGGLVPVLQNPVKKVSRLTFKSASARSAETATWAWGLMVSIALGSVLSSGILMSLVAKEVKVIIVQWSSLGLSYFKVQLL